MHHEERIRKAFPEGTAGPVRSLEPPVHGDGLTPNAACREHRHLPLLVAEGAQNAKRVSGVIARSFSVPYHSRRP